MSPRRWRTALSLVVWPLFVLVPIAANAWLIARGLDRNLAFLVCLLGAGIGLYALEKVLPKEDAWLEDDGQLSNDLALTVGSNLVVGPIVATALEALLLLAMVALAPADSTGAWALGPARWPLGFQLVLALALIEGARYWGHRLSHTNSFLWQFHSLHHSTERLTVLNLGRIHPGELAPLLLGVIPIALLSIPDDLVYWQGVFAMYVSLLAHSNLDLRTGPLDYLFNTPNLHRWHHSNKIHECNHNYCHSLSLLDLAFGTYLNRGDRIPAVLGVPMPYPKELIAQLRYPFVSRVGGQVIEAVGGATWTAPPRPVPRGGIEIELVGRGSVEGRRGETVLDAFDRAGEKFPQSCRIGECGACKTLLRAGRVRISAHCAAALSPEQAEAGLFLACCSTPLERCEIALGKPVKQRLRELSRPAVTPPGSPQKVAVIGAGFAGLGVAEALRRHGIAYEQLERQERLGGVWLRGTYPGVHLITSRRTTGYTTDPMPDHLPDFPGRDQVLDYLESFAERHGLLEQLRLGTGVSAVHPIDGGARWSIRFDDGTERSYAAVVVATGHHWSPRRPEVEGRFAGVELHSSECVSFDVFEGRRVLVVGGGNSAVDLAAAASRCATSVDISMRGGHWYLPKTFRGRPTGELLESWLPLGFLRLVVRAMLALTVGDYRSYGLERPDHRLFDRDPVLTDGFLSDLRHGRIRPRRGLRRLAGDRVEFVDGEEGEYDVICWATGFDVTLPAVGPDLVPFEDGVPQLVAGLFAPRHRNLYVFGVGHLTRPIPRYGVGPTISAGAEVVALALRLQSRLRRPLGELVGKLFRTPLAAEKIDPTRALVGARLAAWSLRAWLWWLRQVQGREAAPSRLAKGSDGDLTGPAAGV